MLRTWRNKPRMTAARPALWAILAIVILCGSSGPALAWTPVPSSLATGKPAPAVLIGDPGDTKDYYAIDRGVRLDLLGPGNLRFFVRAFVSSAGAAPESIWVSVTGGASFESLNASFGVPASRTQFADAAIAGLPSGGAEVTVELPEGANELVVMGVTDTGEPVYAIFYYDGSKDVPKPVAEAAPPARIQVTANAACDFIYDDNIARLSDPSIHSFKIGENTDEYAINTLDDVILAPSINIELARPLIKAQRTRLRFAYTTWQYMRNSIKANEEINVRLRQHTSSSNYFETSYTYAPSSYIKELRDRPPFTSASVDRVYLPFKISRNQFSFGYFWRVSSFLRLNPEIGRVLRYYNRPFLENDLWEWNAELTTSLYWRRLQWQVAYRYSEVKARGYDSVGETLMTSDEESDGSYDKDSYRLRITYRPKRSPYRRTSDGAVIGAVQSLGALLDSRLTALVTSALWAEVSYARQFYTSRLPLHLDPLHVGRLDETKQLRIGWDSRAIWQDASLGLEWRYTVRIAKAPAGIIGEDDPSEEKDYTGNRFTFTVSRPLN